MSLNCTNWAPAAQAGQWICRDCGGATPAGRQYEKPPVRACRNPPELRDAAAELGLAKLAANWTGAVLRWVRAGRPKRTADEVRGLYEKHCEPCPDRVPDEDRCRACGCRVSPDDGLAITNKLKMATEGCPAGRFPPAVPNTRG